MPVGVLALGIGAFIIVAVSFCIASLAIGKSRAQRRERAVGSAHSTTDAASSSATWLRSMLFGFGCALLSALMLAVAMFAFVIWAFKHFTLF